MEAWMQVCLPWIDWVQCQRVGWNPESRYCLPAGSAPSVVLGDSISYPLIRSSGNALLILESDDELEERAKRTAATLNED